LIEQLMLISSWYRLPCSEHPTHRTQPFGQG
jgi:hypothetical protein